jgi:hypothetical protein
VGGNCLSEEFRKITRACREVFGGIIGTWRSNYRKMKGHWRNEHSISNVKAIEKSE